MPPKQFDKWFPIKETLHYKHRSPAISEGEIWWCSFGENIGIEINGKNTTFTRPVLIFKKLSRTGFMGIPLTSQEKHGSWYYKFYFSNREQYAALCQARVLSTSRLQRKIGEISNMNLSSIKQSFIQLYS